MPRITHPDVEGTALVSDRTAPFWLRNGWQPVEDEPAEVPVDDLLAANPSMGRPVEPAKLVAAARSAAALGEPTDEAAEHGDLAAQPLLGHEPSPATPAGD